MIVIRVVSSKACKILMVFFLLVGGMSLAQAVVLVSPELTTGVGSIDPPGSRDIDVIASGSTPKEDLESMRDFKVIQSFKGFEAGTNTIIFPDENLPDIKISFETDDIRGVSGQEITNRGFVTSGDSGIGIFGATVDAAQTISMSIELGQSPDGRLFDYGTQTASALAFTIASAPLRLLRVSEITAQFLDDDGTVLSTQSVEGLTEDASAYFFGFRAERGTSISSVQVRIDILPGVAKNHVGELVPTILGFDDLGIAPFEQ